MNQNIHELAKTMLSISERMKELEADKKKVRQQIFSVADDSYNGKEYMLPTTTITVPVDFLRFFHDNSEFLNSRFPGWECLSAKGDGDEVTFVLRKRPTQMGFTFEDEEVKLARSVAEYTPDLDWNLMEQYEPNLFNKIARPVVTHELDEEALQALVSVDSTVINKIRKYAIVKQPTLRVLASNKNG